MESPAEIILSNLRRGHPRSRTNVVLLGLPGVGKSSLTNSLIFAINQESETFQVIAKSGSVRHGASGGAVTRWIKKYQISEHLKDPTNQERVRYKSQVFIWDTPGLQNFDDCGMNEALKRLFAGKLHETDDPRETARENHQEGPMKVEEYFSDKMYSLSEMIENEINLILFVHACNDPVPENLINAITTAKYDCRKEIEVCLIATKIDLVQEEEEDEVQNSIMEAAKYLLIEDEAQVFRVELYQRHAKRNPAIDQNMWKIWGCIQNKEYVGHDLSQKQTFLRVQEDERRELRRMFEKMRLQEKKDREVFEQQKQQEERRRLQQEEERARYMQIEIKRQEEQRRLEEERRQGELRRLEEELRRRDEYERKQQERQAERRHQDEQRQREYQQVLAQMHQEEQRRQNAEAEVQRQRDNEIQSLRSEIRAQRNEIERRERESRRGCLQS